MPIHPETNKNPFAFTAWLPNRLVAKQTLEILPIRPGYDRYFGWGYNAFDGLAHCAALIWKLRKKESRRSNPKIYSFWPRVNEMSQDSSRHLPLDEPEDVSLVKIPSKRTDPLLRFESADMEERRAPIAKTSSNFDVLNTDPKVETVRRQASVLKIEKSKRRCNIM
jgi:hypothetical protein